MHKTINPKIFYFGTPVVLISTTNEDRTINLAPISSAWWMNQSCMIGMSGQSQTVINLLREGECTLNLPSANLVEEVDRLALLTGRNPVPEYKREIGYQYEQNKFSRAGLTSIHATNVGPPLVKECPIQLEAVVQKEYDFDEPSAIKAFEMKIVTTHIDEKILLENGKDYIDPEKWKPLMMNFCEFFSFGPKLYPSKLAEPFTSRYYAN
ncbi:flavin reductase family protein [Bacillus carboniphilus]|uniref:Flavin reductase family protein n=1 Tax=Bacillus carboniphilus TaxID=86663 RepID=A0ABY9JRT9_9BACI|nr:flavin reductase family protein [Bacillus carboniphilus]WLR42057.1 flavin reductase family protein [Bacillus carboniphilus]